MSNEQASKHATSLQGRCQLSPAFSMAHQPQQLQLVQAGPKGMPENFDGHLRLPSGRTYRCSL